MDRTTELENRNICRICLDQSEDANFCNIFGSNLPMEILSIGSVEVFESDGMPSKVCETCKTILGNAYKFKQICKRSDTLLKMYPVTGIVPPRIEIPQEMLPSRKHPVVVETEKISIGVGSDALETSEASVQTDAPPIAETIEQMEVVHYEDVASLEQSQFEAMKDEVVETSSSRQSVKILNKSKTESTPPKQFKKPSSVKIERSNFKPMILNSQLNNSNVEEAFIQIGTITNDDVEVHTEYTMTGQIEEEFLEEHEWNDKKESQDKSDDKVVYICDVCSRSYPLQQQLVLHRKIHDRERNHPCPECDKSFFTKYDLAKHSLTHTKQKDYTCIVCKKSFSRSTLLYRHEKCHTDPKLKRHNCDQCDRTYLNIADYKKHIIVHTKNRPFACSFCDKRFAFKQGLERHEVCHDYSLLPHECKYCDQRFSTAPKLQRHLSKEHAGTRPFPCGKCSKRFMLSHHLHRHTSRFHAVQEITSFQCPECDDIVDSREGFFSHCIDHASYTNTCPLCKAEFDNVDDVQEHINEHSKSDMYYCDYCSLIYMSTDELNNHFAEQHSNELCSVDEEIDVFVDKEKPQADETKKRKTSAGFSKSSKKSRQEDILAYEIEELGFLDDDYVESSGPAFVEYDEEYEYVDVKPAETKKKTLTRSSAKTAETKELPIPKKQAIGKVRKSADEIEKLIKEGKIEMINGKMVMREKYLE